MASFTSLPMEDVIFTQIFSRLSIVDIIRLKIALEDCRVIVDAYLNSLKYIRWELVPAYFRKSVAVNTGNLRAVDLSGAAIVTDDFVDIVLTLNRKITDLNLQSCPCLSMHGVRPIAQLKLLKKLSVKKNEWANNQFLYHICANLDPDNLRSVDFSGCPVTDSAIGEFLKKFQRLEQIELEDCQLISDCTADAIAVNCKELQHLNVGWSLHVGENFIRQVVSGCSKLRTLRMIGCPMIGTALKESLPKGIIFE